MSSESGWCSGGRQNWGQNGGVFSHRSYTLMTLVSARRHLGFVWLDEVPPQEQLPSGPSMWTRWLPVQCSSHTSRRPLTTRAAFT